MTTCQARLPIGERPRAMLAPSGRMVWIQRRCTQTVGVTTLTDGQGRDWHACARVGHTLDVFRQLQDAELAERAHHEHEEDARAEALAEVRADDRRAAWLDDERESEDESFESIEASR